MTDPTISATLIIKNEADNLERCLNSIYELVQEIIIVDTGSTDRSLEIAKQFTDKIYSFDWCDDYAKARNEALKYATQDWILIINGDEYLDPRAVQKIPNYLSRLNTPRPAILLFRLLTPGQATLYVRGLFPNHQGIAFKGRVHEFPFHPDQELMGLECPHLIIHHRPNYSATKYHYDKDLLLLDLKDLSDPYERAMHLFHFGRNELLLENKVAAFEALHAALFHFYESQAKANKRLHLNLLQYLSRLALEDQQYELTLKYSRRLNQIFSEFHEAWLWSAQGYFYLGEHQKAKTCCLMLLQTLQRWPSPPEFQDKMYFVSHLFLARLAVLQKDFAQGIHILLHLYEQNSLPEIALHLARAYALSGNLNFAVVWQRKSGFEEGLISFSQTFNFLSQKEMVQSEHLSTVF